MAVSRVAARRALVSRAYAGGAIAAGALVGYGGYKAIKRIRAARARKAKVRRIGQPRKPMQAKIRGTIVTNQNIDTRTLYSEPMCVINKGIDINERFGDTVNFAGFRLQFHIKNQGTIPQRVSVAIVSGKVLGDAVTSVPTAEFLRGYGTDRAKDFSTADSTLVLMDSPINADKYEVLKRWNFDLGNREGASNDKAQIHKSSEYRIEKYIPFKRQLRYESTTSATEPENGNLFLCYWIDREMSAAGALAQSNDAYVQIRVLAYYRDAKT